MSRRLLVNDGGRDRELLLVATMVVGRDPACEITGTDALLSRRHAEFSLAGDRAMVRDLGSRNGVFVNGARVAESVLRANDLVQIGGLKIRYVEDNQPISAASHTSPSPITIDVPDGDATGYQPLPPHAPTVHAMPADQSLPGAPPPHVARTSTMTAADVIARPPSVDTMRSGPSAVAPAPAARALASARPAPSFFPWTMAVALLTFAVTTASLLLWHRWETAASAPVTTFVSSLAADLADAAIWLAIPLVIALGVAGAVSAALARRASSEGSGERSRGSQHS